MRGKACDGDFITNLQILDDMIMDICPSTDNMTKVYDSIYSIEISSYTDYVDPCFLEY